MQKQTLLFLLRLVIGVFVLLVCQSTWVHSIAVAGIYPDLFIGVVFYLVLKRGALWGVWGGCLLGLLIDVEQPARLGLNSLAFVLAALLVDRGSKSFERTNPVVLLMLFFLAALCADAIRALWLSGGSPAEILRLFARRALPGAIYTSFFIPPAAWMVARILGLRRGILGAP